MSVSIYDLGAAPQPQFYMVGNAFNANLLKYASMMCGRGQFLNFLPPVSAFSVSDKTSKVSDGESRIEVFSMPGMQDTSRRLVDEVCAFWAPSFSFPVERHLGTLWIDYLLTSSVCYVEVSRSGKVDKFFGTRSLSLIEKLVPPSSVERNRGKWESYLAPVSSDYVNDKLRILRIASLQTEPKVSVPKAAFNCAEIVSITPVCIMSEYSRIFLEMLKTHILRFTYKKDNGQVRTMDSTCNPAILSQVYSEDWVNRVVSSAGSVLNRGYIRIPELGISKYDASGLRAVDVGRIQGVSVVGLQDVDLSYVNVDFTCIAPTFQTVVASLHSVQILQMLYMRVTGSPAPANLTTPDALHTAILDYVSVQLLLSSTVFQRYLHSLMISLPQLFLNYDGAGLPGVVDSLTGSNVVSDQGKLNVTPGGVAAGEDDMIDTGEYLAVTSEGYSADMSCLGFDLK